MKSQITFREKMNLYNKDSLKMFAKDLKINGTSRLNKGELVEKIAGEFLPADRLFYRISILDDDAFSLLEAASRESVGISPHSGIFDTACILNQMEVADFDTVHTLRTLSDVWETYEKEIDHKKFNAYRERASWVWKCLRWAEGMYADTPESILLAVANRKNKLHMHVGELREIFDHVPADMRDSVRIGDRYIYDLFLYNHGSMERLSAAQQGKDFYIPRASEVEEYFRTCALLSKKPYQDMLVFLADELKMGRAGAEDLLTDLWDNISFEDDPHGSLQWFWDHIELEDDAQLEKAISLYTPLANGTNMLANRGYAPADMPHPVLKPGEKPTIVPGSSKMAGMLAESMPDIQQMGFNVDLDSNAATVPVFHMPNGINGPMQMTQKKIYPNDPCPCGSGKKYKKCCGR